MTDKAVLATEVIAFCSGKGGTGKTSLIAALGYALIYSGHRVLMIDADRATDGLSLFILGPHGMNQIGDYKPANTFSGILDQFAEPPKIDPQPRIVHRVGPNDHDLSYEAIISGKGLYGDQSSPITDSPVEAWNRQFDRETFQRCVRQLFQQFRQQQAYDYVLVDSRGGFSFESTDVAAAADSFVLVTEATNTNFYQDRNLVDRINAAAAQMQTKSLLRGIIVNKSTEPPEFSYRQELVKEFHVRLEDTFPVALDLEAAAVYKTQRVIYREAPASRFAFDSLQAFHQILKVVTSQWLEDRARRWNELIARVDSAIAEHNALVELERRRQEEQTARTRALETDHAALKSEVETLKAAYEQERRRQDILLEEFKSQARLREETWRRELEREQERALEDKTTQTREADRLLLQLKEDRAQLDQTRKRLQELETMAFERERAVDAARYEARQIQVESRGKSRLYIAIISFLAVLTVAAGLYAVVLSRSVSQVAERLRAEAEMARIEADNARAAREKAERDVIGLEERLKRSR